MLMAEMRPIIFVLVLVVCWLLQHYQPRRQQNLEKGRLVSNFGLLLAGNFLLWLTLPAAAVAASLWAEQSGLGLFNLIKLPTVFSSLAVIVALDFAIYWQHRAMHQWPILWRLHRAHHSDLQLDTSSALRFHPLEILLSMLYKAFWIILLGASIEALLCYQVILSSFALFNHSNWHMPADSSIRKLLVTPDVHRLHHSINPAETNSNYGNFLVLWDKLFGSYQAQPELGHQKMVIGLEQYRDEQSQKLLTLLFNPFR